MRLISTCGSLLVLAGFAFAEGRSDNDTLQVAFEKQFAELDVNHDDKLDAKERNGITSEDLSKLKDHGMTGKSSLTRAEFTAIRMAAVAAETKAAVVAAGSNAAEEPSEASDGDSPVPAESGTHPSRNDTLITPEVPAKQEGAKPDVASSGTTARELNSTAVEVSPGAATVIGVTPRTTRTAKKTHLVPELPAPYSVHDKNGDGQIGLYEWDRKKYSEFAELDKNGDGFLTPAELLPKGSLQYLYSRSASRESSGGDKRPSEAASGEDPTDKEARSTFAQMDSEMDGKIDETEWGRSRRIRPMFESAGIQVSLPMDTETFVGLYRRAREAGGRGESR